MENILEMNEALLEREKELIELIDQEDEGSVERDNYLKELEKLQTIRQRNERGLQESEKLELEKQRFNLEKEKSQNESDAKIKELEARITDNEKRSENEKKRGKLDFISKIVSTAATFLLGIIILSFEEKGFIRSKVFGWIKFK